MAFSVNTNAGALSALQNLNQTQRGLQTTQGRINTGLEVAGARDGAAFFNIAQGLRADLAGLSAVQGSLNDASTLLDVSLAATEAVSDLLNEGRELAVRASDEALGDDARAALGNEFNQLVDQIDSIVTNASFNGRNAINGANSDVISAITTDNGGGVISVSADGAGAGFNLLSSALGGTNSLASTNVDFSASTGVQGAAAAAVVSIDAAIEQVQGVLSDLGAFGTRLDIQSEFTNSLADSIEVGIGNLVDANLAQESANLQALQVQQQLGLSALSIANQAPQSILGLF